MAFVSCRVVSTRAAPPSCYDFKTTMKAVLRLTVATVAAITVAASVTLARPFVAFFNGFNRGFERFASFYGQMTARLVRLTTAILAVYGGLLGLTGWQFGRAPTGRSDERRVVKEFVSTC